MLAIARLKVPQTLFGLCLFLLVCILAGSASGCGSPLAFEAQQCTELPNKNPEAAVKACTALLNSGKLSTHDVAGAYLARGAAYTALKKYRIALDDLNQSISVEPHIEAFNSRGIAYDQMGDYAHALQDYDEVIRLQPGYAHAYNNRGLVNSEKGDEQKALQDFDKAISLKSDYAEAITNRAGTFLKYGEYDKAIQDLTADLPLEKGSPYPLIVRAQAYTGKKDYPRALDDLTRATDLSPNDEEIYYARGATYFNLGKLDLAVLDSCKAVSLSPTDLNNVIWCYMTTARNGGSPDIGALKHALERRDTPWPAPVVRMLAGQMSPEELLKAAKTEGKEPLCEAYFFIAEDAIIHNRPSDAKKLFEKAVAPEFLDTFEYFAARAELDRMTRAQRH